jgi:hypothetical protein
LVTGIYIIQDKNSNDYRRHRLPKRDKFCEYCQALMWESEKLNACKNNVYKFGFCCLHGQVDLPPLSAIPKELLELLTITNETKEFKANIRLYNSVLAFTSSSANVDESLMRANQGVYTYRINGAVHHKLSNSLPNPDFKPHFSQIYIYDSAMQANIRTNMFPVAIKASILNTIQKLLEMGNPYVRVYMQAGKMIQNSPDTQYNIVIKANVTNDRTKNKPSSDEIAVLMVEDDNTNINKRDIVVKARNSNERHPFTFINENLSMYDALAYPLLHLTGEPGWQYKYYAKRPKENPAKASERQASTTISYGPRENSNDPIVDDANEI